MRPSLAGLRRRASRGLRKAADICDPFADLIGVANVETRVLTPRALGAPIAGLRYLFVGLCEIGLLADAGPALGCSIEHVLYDSGLYAELPPFEPDRHDAVIMAITMRQVLNEAYGEAFDLKHARPDWDEHAARTVLDRCVELLRRQFEAIQAHYSGAPTFILSFLEPSFSYLGLLQPGVSIEHPKVFVAELNREMYRLLDFYPGLYPYDLNDAFNAVGRLHLHDDVVSGFTHGCIIGNSDDALDADRLVPVESNHHVFGVRTMQPMVQRYIFRDLADAVKIVRGADWIKLVIVDLDDTLWRGVAAEGEFEGWMRTEGWPLGFAEALLYYKRRGGLLAICSKNEPGPTIARFREIWGDRLSLDDVVSVQIGWGSKVEGVRRILNEANFLAEHVLFIDDNPRELAEVEAAIPGLRCLRGRHLDWRRIILRAPETQVPTITEEARRRSNLVQATIARNAAEPVADRSTWLASLDLQASFELIETPAGPKFRRAFELLNKTNQFNTNGRRWSLSELSAFLRDGGSLIAASVKDRSVDNGLTSVALVKPGEILQVVLSCRVFGLGVEIALGSIAMELALSPGGEVRAGYVDTAHNLSSRGFFERLGFTGADGALSATHASPAPTWIDIRLEPGLQRALRDRRPAVIATRR